MLQRQLVRGLQETAQQQVVIEDCDPMIFKAFLRHLYTDSFALLEGLIAEKAGEQSIYGELTVQNQACLLGARSQ